MANETSKIPADLIVKLASLTNEIEEAVRADERARVRERLVAAWNDHGEPLVSGLAAAQTDMHGEPVGSATPSRQPVKLSAGHLRVRDLLSGSRFIARPTLAGLADIRRSTVSTYLNDLKRHGYVIEKRKLDGTGYRVGYRLAKAG
jgi:DNA-binding IclR family transcriptional regulator